MIPNLPTDPAAAMQQGIAEANAGGDQAKVQEAADVKAWLERIKKAREFDKNARKRYAIDREFARGERGGFEVSLPIAGTYVDILKAFLYAKDPDLDVQPADGTSAPPMAEIIKQAREQVAQDPQTQIAMQAAAHGAITQAQQQQATAAVTAIAGAATGAAPGAPPAQVDPQQAGQMGANAAFDQIVKQKADEIMAPHKERASDAKQFAETLESIIAYLWQKGRLKAAAEPLVGSALTCGPGWLKITWQEQDGITPVTQQKIDDLTYKLTTIQQGQATLDDGSAPNPDATKQQLENQIAELQQNVEVLFRGLAIDFVPAEDVQVSTDVPTIAQYRDASFIDHRIFMSLTEARAKFPDLAVKDDDDRDKLDKATKFYQREPRDPYDKPDTGRLSKATADDADQYVSGSTNTFTPKAGDEPNVCVHETWSRAQGQIITTIEGIDCYAVKPYAPKPQTTRFYGFFLFAPTKVDGERHPQSMVQRTESLLEDMNRIATNRAEFRRRTLPKTVFSKGQLTPTDAKAIANGGQQEMVGVDPTDPTMKVGDIVAPLNYARFDPALYDDGPIRAQLESAWGIQEALASSIEVAKTATEATIQQNGTDARTGYMRDCLDEMMNEVAEYTAEVALQSLEKDDAVTIAGPFAFWPDQLAIGDLSTLVLVKIQAGSSGKPNTQAQRQAWAQVAPTIQNLIVQIGQMRGASPESTADALQEFADETLKRLGDKLDTTRFFPNAPDNGGAPPMMAQPQPAAPAPVPQPGAMAA